MLSYEAWIFLSQRVSKIVTFLITENLHMDKHVEKSRKKNRFLRKNLIESHFDCFYACKLSDIMKYCLCKYM